MSRTSEQSATRTRWAACTLLACATTAFADEYRYNNILIGDRAAGMGGAYVAISDDPSGLYYNPAGIVYTAGSSVSGSMNALHTTNSTYKDALGGRFDWHRTSSTLLPNFFGVFQPLGDGKLGFSYAVVDSVQENQDQTFNAVDNNIDQYIINFNNQDTTYNIGPSYATALNDAWSFGITLYGHMRTQERILNQVVFGTYGAGINDEEWSNEYNALSEYGVRPVIGLMWSPTSHISVGMNINRVVVVSSTREIQNTCKGADNPARLYSTSDVCQNGQVTRRVSESELKNQYPIQARVGIAYFPSPRLVLSSDVIYNTPTDDGKEAVLDVALGGEYYITPQWAVRAGLTTANSNTPQTQAGDTNQAPHVDLAGMAFSLTHFSRNSALSAGLAYAQGSGKAQLFADDPRVQALDITTLTLFMSAVYAY